MADYDDFGGLEAELAGLQGTVSGLGAVTGAFRTELEGVQGSMKAAGALVTAGFEFDVPVRFDTDRIAVSYAGFAAGEIPSIPVIEVRV